MNVRTMPLIAALVTLAVHLLGNAHYGFFRDELYFIVCGFHPAWGYVDQPPVVPLLAAGSQLFGHSLFLLRLVPALFAAGGAYVVCLLVIEFGGGVYAQIVSTLAYLFAGVLLSFGGKVTPDEVGIWTWPLAALYVLRIVKGGDARLWLLAGAVLGFSMESKYSVGFFGVALLAGLVLTPQRRIFASPWFFAGMALATLIALPNLVWQFAHGLPMLELLRNGQDVKNVNASPALFIVQQILITGFFLAPVWIIGLIWLLRDKTARFLGYGYLILILLMIVFHGKHYYPADVYPIVMAAGGAPIEAWTRGKTFVRSAIAAGMCVIGIVFMPFALPVLPEQPMYDYTQFLAQSLHIGRQTMQTEHNRTSKLPEDWADMHGWPELVATVAGVYNALPPDQRAQAAIYTDNYGEAAAIDFFGAHYGLPPALSGHNNYWLWGTHGYSGNVIVDVNGDCAASAHIFKTSRLAARFDGPWVISYEHDIPIMVCTGIKQPLITLWPQARHYI